MLIYTILLTLISIVTAVFITAAAYHTTISDILEYVYISQIILAPIAIWLVYIVNKQYQYFSNITASIINTLLLVAIPFASGVAGRLIIDYQARLFEKFKTEIVIDNIEDRLYYSKDDMPIGITIEFRVTSPRDVRLYPYANLKSVTQPTQVLIPRYPEFRYHECELKDEAGHIIFTSTCKDLAPSAYDSIGWLKHTLKSGNSYTFSISMVPDNCVSAKYSLAGIGKPFTTEDYGLDTPVNYQAEIDFFQHDRYHITSRDYITKSKYLPKSFYKNLSMQNEIQCH